MKVFTCSNCQDTKEETIPAIGHDWGEPVIHEPTCEEDGLKVFTCSNCQDTKEETIPAIGHDWGEPVINEPTCEEDGLSVITCSNCQATKEETIPAIGHSPVEDWSINEKTHFHRCETCGNPTDEEEHIWDYEEATEEHGISCTVCGYVLEEAKPPVIEPDGTNILSVDVETTADGQSTVTVRLSNSYMAGIRFTVHHGDVAIHRMLAPEAAIYHDADGELRYTLVSETNYTEELTLITLTVSGTNPEIHVEIVEIYAFDEEFNIIVPDYAEAQ